MSTTKQPVGSRTALTVTGLGTLASATFVASNAYDAHTSQPLDVVIEVEVTTTNTPSGAKQVVVYAQASLDGTNYQSGPTSGTTVTAEPELTFLGIVPLPTTSVQARKSFSLAAAYNFCPPYFKIIIKNESGVALTAGAVYTAEVSSTSS